MFILGEKIVPPRAQIFNDYVAEDAALKQREDDARWVSKVRYAIDSIIRSVRRV